MTESYELANRDRVLRFKGSRIGHASSRVGRDSDQLRWTEVDVYVTTGGHYVLHKIGKSRVYHAGPAMCSGTSGRKTTARSVMLWDRAARDDLAPCPVCCPGPVPEHAELVVERDRGQTFTSTTARGIVESAYSQDDDGVIYLTKVAERALAEASEVDPDVREAFRVDVIA